MQGALGHICKGNGNVGLASRAREALMGGGMEAPRDVGNVYKSKYYKEAAVEMKTKGGKTRTPLRPTVVQGPNMA